jgi:hypothetical protein
MQSTRRLFDRVFGLKQWYIGWAQATIDEFLADPGSVSFKWIVPARKAVFLADPFGVEADDGRLLIYAERLEHGVSHGEIVLIDTASPDESAWHPVLARAHHLSYPFVVRVGPRRHLIPEQGYAGDVTMYELMPDGTVGDKALRLLDSWPALDTTPLEHAGRWWMFSTKLGDANWGGALRLHVAQRLEGPWLPHPRNPVVTDVGRARPAGRIIEQSGRLLRPAQDCSRVYGEAIVINEITKLTPDEYEERPVARITSQQVRAPGGVACHHLDHTARYVLIDVMRVVHHPLAWWYKWRDRRRARGVARRLAGQAGGATPSSA